MDVLILCAQTVMLMLFSLDGNPTMKFQYLKTKLYRNLKPGDIISVECNITDYRKEYVKVNRVQETTKYWHSVKRIWEIHGEYPWWWPGPIRAYSNEKCDVYKQID